MTYPSISNLFDNLFSDVSEPFKFIRNYDNLTMDGFNDIKSMYKL